MIQASIAGNERGDRTMMRRMFGEISDPIRGAAMDRAIGSLHRLGFPLNDQYIATMEPGHVVAVTLAGVGGDQFMARTDSAILIGQVSDLPSPRPARGDMFSLTPSLWDRAMTPDGL